MPEFLSTGGVPYNIVCLSQINGCPFTWMHYSRDWVLTGQTFTTAWQGGHNYIAIALHVGEKMHLVAGSRR